VSRGTQAVRARRPLVCRSASANPTGAGDKLVPAQTLVGDDLEQWKACVALVEGVGFEADKAEEILTRAFGWGSQAYWRKSKVNQVPSPAQVEESLNFIQELMENKESDVVKVVSGFPESLAIGVEDGPPGLKYASNFIEDSWKMKGKAKTMTIARKPAVLGCQIDCRGDCAGQCHYCWATA